MFNPYSSSSINVLTFILNVWPAGWGGLGGLGGCWFGSLALCGGCWPGWTFVCGGTWFCGCCGFTCGGTLGLTAGLTFKGFGGFCCSKMIFVNPS